MQELIDIVGAPNAAQHDGVLRVAPSSTEEVSAVLKYCDEHHIVVTATGRGTKLGWGNPVSAAVLVDLSRLTGVSEHSWQDLTATVAAGTTWEDMQSSLAQHHQRVALDPLFAQRATVGGVLAANDSGLLRMKYGSLRDLILGMTIVLADGTIAQTGGKVVKNVAGYDLPKLLTGSFGTLGLITEATFRLHPVAQHTAAFTVRSLDVASLADLMTAVLKANMSLEAMQLRTETLAYALDLQFASLPEVLREHEERLRSLAPTLAIEPADAGILNARDLLFTNTEATILKITALPSKLAAIVAGVAQLAQLPDHAAQCVADPVGIVTVALTASAEQLSLIVEDLRARLAGVGGAVVVLQRGALPQTMDPWGPAPAPLEIMRSIKREFDANHILNPGKFVGGI